MVEAKSTERQLALPNTHKSALIAKEYKKKTKEAVTFHWASLCLATIKVPIGVVCNSSAIITDGLFDITNVIRNQAYTAGYKASVPVSTMTYPYGKGKYMPLYGVLGASMSMGVIACMTGLGFASLVSAPYCVTFAGAVSACALFFVRGGLFQYYQSGNNKMVDGKKKHDAPEHNLVYDEDNVPALRHREALLPSIIAFGSAFVSAAGVPFVDACGVFIIAAFTMRSVWLTYTRNAAALVEKNVEHVKFEQILATLDELKLPVEVFYNLRVRNMGPYFVADMRVLLPTDLDIESGCSLVKLIQTKVEQKVHRLREFNIFMDCESEEERKKKRSASKIPLIHNKIFKIVEEADLFRVYKTSKYHSYIFNDYHVVLFTAHVDPTLLPSKQDEVSSGLRTFILEQLQGVVDDVIINTDVYPLTDGAIDVLR